MKSIFENETFKPYQEAWNARQKEFARRKSYYDGSIYRKVRESSFMGPRLYKGVKALYLPLARAVDVDAGIIPGGWDFAEDTPETFEQARDLLFSWSRWAVNGVLYVHYGAQYGVTGLKVSDLREAKRVIVSPVDPQTFLLIPSGTYDPTPAMAILVEKRGSGESQYEYAEVITPASIQTYRNGEPYGYDDREPEYPNELGFVPVVEAAHMLTGEPMGECTFQKSIPLLDEVNELASYLADIIKKHVEPQWAVSGAEAGELIKSGDNVWFLPAGGEAKALVAAVDVKGVLEFVQEVRDQVHANLPELAFDELRNKDQIATATLELQLMELVLKVKRCRPNYDEGLVTALRLAGRAAATLGIGELSILDSEDLALDADRAVLPMDPQTEMALEMQALALEREKAMGIQESQPVEDEDEPEA
jgi:hypothetical protein